MLDGGAVVRMVLSSPHPSYWPAAMLNPVDHPLLILAVCFTAFWAAARLGAWIPSKRRHLEIDTIEDLKIVLGATLTLLALIIGFTFSMAVTRYDQRKNLEEEEANAIGTEYVRGDLMTAEQAAKLHALLRSYLEARITFYTMTEPQQLERINLQTAKLQKEMWAEVLISVSGGSGEQNAVKALVVEGMNDVLNSQGYTQAAWWNRIPMEGWALMIGMGIFCNALLGIFAQGRSRLVLLVLPIALSVALFLIADIDSPRRGLIRLHPQNLESLANSLGPY